MRAFCKHRLSVSALCLALICGMGSIYFQSKFQTIEERCRDLLISPSAEETATLELAACQITDTDSTLLQESPPSPLDHAVIFKKLQSLGLKKISSTALWHFQQPDAASLNAWQQVVDRFDSLIVGVPLSRSSKSESVPIEMRRSSLNWSQVRGDAKSIPIVNRLMISPLQLGGKNAKVGFCLIEREMSDSGIPLLARWDDCILLNSNVLSIADDLNVPLSQLQITLGESIVFGESLKKININESGMWKPLTPSAGKVQHKVKIDELFDTHLPHYQNLEGKRCFYIDRQSSQDMTMLEWSQSAMMMSSSMYDDVHDQKNRVYSRLAWLDQMAWVLMISGGLAVGALCLPKHLWIVWICGLMSCVWAQWLMLDFFHIWLPFTVLFITTTSVLALFIFKLIFIRNQTSC